MSIIYEFQFEISSYFVIDVCFVKHVLLFFKNNMIPQIKININKEEDFFICITFVSINTIIDVICE